MATPSEETSPKQQKPVITNTIEMLKQFFSTYLWVGVIILLVTVIIDVSSGEKKDIYTKIGIELLRTVGIAVIVAALFDFASGTASFYKAVREFLEQIVIKKDFLKVLGDKEKREVLAAIIAVEDSRTYNNINTYYEQYIDHTIKIMRKTVRTDYKMVIDIYHNIEENRIDCRVDVSYRLYPSIDGYGEMKMITDTSDNFFCKSLQITNSQNKILKTFSIDEIKNLTADGNLSGRPAKQLVIDLNKIGGTDKYLKVYSSIIEKGHDHWYSFSFQALQPTEGFDLTVICSDDIEIKEEATFISGADFHVVERTPERRRILCDTWFNEGTGLSLVAARKTEIDQPAPRPAEEAGRSGL
jgi:hypothetical protein